MFEIARKRSRRILGGYARSVRLNVRGLVKSHSTRIGTGADDVLQILCLHHVKHDEKRLVEFVHWLRMRYDIIPYRRAIEMITQNNVSRQSVSITFDDGLIAHYHAARVLADLGVSACFFVCPGMMREDPDIRLAEFFRARLLMKPTELMGWSDLHELVELDHEIGSHTLTHPDLSQLDTDAAQREIRESKSEIESELGVCNHFAWPYGQLATMPVSLIRYAHEIGYESVASAISGCYPSAPSHLDPWIRRVALETTWSRRSLRYLLSPSV